MRAARASRKPAVLLVEDDDDTRALMSLVLRKDYEVLPAADARQARAKLAAHFRSVRLILMDLRLPGPENGIDLTRSIRGTPGWRRIPIVAATACSRPEDEEQARKAGCDEYLVKPFYPRQLLSVVERHLLRKPMRSSRNGSE